MSLLTFICSILACNSDNQITDLSPEKHNEYYEKGTSLISPYMQLHDKPRKAPNKRKIRQGIRYLDAVTTINHQNWAAFWIKGKAYQALHESESAYQEFKKSYEIQKENADVARELMMECLNLGKGKEGVEVAIHALNIEPNNPGLMANVGLAYLINGQLKEAEDITRKSLEIDPADKITNALLKFILEVKSGERKQPNRYSDLFN